MELLAPAGSMEAFKAALENGADAIYLGGQMFNARQSAANFTIEEIKEAVRLAHLRGVRVYITINVLISDNEIDVVIEYIKNLMDCNIDAIIIQDLGLLNICKRLFPELPLHASTQMTIHNSYGAKWFSQEGFKRIVLARELSLDEIKHIARTNNIELETFVHGALCISYSGQCLFSSMVGGRSGNRGKCAQPCRMSYQLVDESGKDLLGESFGNHLLSPKDLNLSELLPKLDEAGITSLKIEGRMKRPEYVATVVKTYRKLLNRMLSGEKFVVLKEEQKDLEQIFNREFTTGYYLFNPGRNLISYKRPNNRGIYLGRILNNDKNHSILTLKLAEDLRVGDGLEIWVKKGGRNGFIVNSIIKDGKKVNEAYEGDIVIVNFLSNAKAGDRVFKTYDIRLAEGARESYLRSVIKRIPIFASVKIKLNEPMQLIFKDEENNVAEVKGTIKSEKALTAPLTETTLLKQLDRLGNTQFKLETCKIDIDEGIILPLSEINAIRREAVMILEEKRLAQYKHYKISSINNEIDKLLQNDKAVNTGLAVAVTDYEAFKAALISKPDLIYIGGEQFRKNTVLTKEELAKALEKAQYFNTKLVFALPRIWHDHEIKYLAERVKIACDVGFTAFQVASPAGIKFVREINPNAEIYADFYFNTFNSYTLQYLISNGVKIATLSPEMTLKQISEFKGLARSECLVFGAIPLVISEHCMIGATLGERTEISRCKIACKEKNHFLQDRLKFKFPILTDMSCRMHIYNAKVLNMLPNLSEMYAISPAYLRLDLRVDKPEVIKAVATAFAEGLKQIKNQGSAEVGILEEKFKRYYPQGFTKGHYYRGVIDTGV